MPPRAPAPASLALPTSSQPPLSVPSTVSALLSADRAFTFSVSSSPLPVCCRGQCCRNFTVAHAKGDQQRSIIDRGCGVSERGDCYSWCWWCYYCWCGRFASCSVTTVGARRRQTRGREQWLSRCAPGCAKGQCQSQPVGGRTTAEIEASVGGGAAEMRGGYREACRYRQFVSKH